MFKDQLAAQMYTVRDFTQTAGDFAATLEHVAATGYPAVQLSAIGAMNGENPAVSAADARRLLDDNGLRCVATHRSWERLRDRTDDEIAFHLTLGCDYAAIGGMPAAYGADGVDGYKRWADDALILSTRLGEAGIRFGYHNHAFEFERFGAERRTFYDTLVDAGGDLYLELDIYWAEHAGFNPVRLIERLAGRLPVVHIKDKEVVGGQPVMAPIGEGNLDWSQIIPSLQAAGTQWFCVEQDECRRDPFDCLRSSFEFLERLALT